MTLWRTGASQGLRKACSHPLIMPCRKLAGPYAAADTGLPGGSRLQYTVAGGLCCDHAKRRHIPRPNQHEMFATLRTIILVSGAQGCETIVGASNPAIWSNAHLTQCQ